ncbi:MAG: nucleoside triphosphate pyrophosphohydrolase family protein [Candidatus Omnitrophota bacterium]
MHLSEYQKQSLKTWGGDQRLIRSFLGVAGEGGEMSECIKKYLRGDFDLEEVKRRAFKEIGDTLYYLAICAHELGLDLDDIAQHNIEKLTKRMADGKIQGDGDER